MKLDLRLLAVVLVVASVPAFAVLRSPGLVHPDEIFQALEPANRLAFGFGVKAWEWQVGLRNWAVPGLLAGLLKLAEVVGTDGVWGRRVVVLVPSLLLHVVALLAVYRFAARRVSVDLARWCVVLVGCAPFTVLFAGRTLSESISGALLLLAFERLDAAERGQGRAAWGSGVCFGLAEVARYGTAPFIVVALLWLGLRRSRLVLPVIGGGAIVAVALGLLDLATWGQVLEAPRLGGLWHSFLEYSTFNVIEGRSGGFGRSPWWAYLPRLGGLVVVASVVVWRKRRELEAWAPLLAALGYLVSISAVPHKEERFLYPAVLVALLAAAPAFVALVFAALRREWLVGVSVLAVSAIAAPFVSEEVQPKGSELVALTARASREGKGLLIVHAGLWGTGGSFFAGGSNLMLLADDARPTATHRWCTADDASSPCFVRAVSDPSIDRAIVMDPFDDALRGATLSALTAAGFVTRDTLGTATWLER